MIFEPLHVQHSIDVHIDQLTVRPRQSLPDSHGFLPSLCCGNFMPFRNGRLKYRAGENDYRHREEARRIAGQRGEAVGLLPKAD